MTKSLTSAARMMAIPLMLLLHACGNDPSIISPGADGFFIVNEGQFNRSNASISFYDRETDQVTNNIFEAVNGRGVGDQAQSMTVWNGKGYIVVQNSAKVEVIDADTYTSLKTISDGIESPRFFIGYSETKGYVSDWGDGFSGSVKVIDLTTNTVTGSIPAGQGPNKMVLRENKLYVANNGGFGYDNTIAIIDTSTDTVVGSITVGDNPNSLQFDKDGNLWVFNSGMFVFNEDFSINEEESTPASLSRVDANNTESLRVSFTKFTYAASGQLSINETGDTLYFIFDGQLFKMATSATTLPTTPLRDDRYYGFAFDPFTGDLVGGKDYAFASNGTIEILSSDGTLKKSFEVGIAPNGCAFK